MSACGLEELKNLLIIIEIRKTQPVRYSVEKGATLWDGGDRVEEKTRCFYVTLRHFNGEIIGRHVGLVCEVEKLRDEWGERRTYRLPAGARGGEHLAVYVYNPAVCDNGSLNFVISTTDKQGAGLAESVSVEPDNCQAVCKFGCQSMQEGHVTRLVSRDDNYLVELRIEFGGRGVAE
jgi:hypothetical protein